MTKRRLQQVLEARFKKSAGHDELQIPGFLKIIHSLPAFRKLLEHLLLSDWMALRRVCRASKRQVDLALERKEEIDLSDLLTADLRFDVRANRRALKWLSVSAPLMRKLKMSTHHYPKLFEPFRHLEDAYIYISFQNYTEDTLDFHAFLQSHPHLHKLSIGGMLPPTSDVLFGSEEFYPAQLKTLDLSHVVAGDFLQLVKADSWLTKLAVEKMPELEEFHFPKQSYLGLTEDLYSLGKFPELTTVIMPSYYGYVADGFQSPTPDNFCQALLSIRKLRSLTFPNYNYEKYSLKPFFDSLKTIKQLESLTIKNSGRGGLLFFHFVCRAKRLTHFELGYNSNWDCSDIHLLSNLSNLRSLALRGFHWKAEFSRLTEILNQHFPFLEVLKLEIGSGKFKEFGASCAVQIDRSLKDFQLDISKCRVGVKFACGSLLRKDLRNLTLIGPPKTFPNQLKPVLNESDFFPVENFGCGLLSQCTSIKTVDLSSYLQPASILNQVSAELLKNVEVFLP